KFGEKEGGAEVTTQGKKIMKTGPLSFSKKGDGGGVVKPGKAGMGGRGEPPPQGRGVGSGPKPEKAAGITADSFG
ncbi:MAG TPA: hypothetical protein QGG35_03620, partial [Candidatus Marinimicrobia bacterium]|nr:hypothetical protein [Candidatus Neomarinimicrobiota bacterium]